ncbi:unnamed protein product [Orchesella dallaii]|uniref:Peptidase S59 domain-containing protein n=1 Tax=Orchesella dallaii TaxID=48710 RepID=A0ABP1Q302_9HEXA
MFGNNSSVFGGFASTPVNQIPAPRLTTGLFGQLAQQQQTIFGGGTATPVFGGAAQQTPSAFGGFGSTSARNMFGQQTQVTPGIFGGSTQVTPGIFGGSTPVPASPFSTASTKTQSSQQSQQAAGTSVCYVATHGKDTAVRNGVSSNVNVRIQSITAMKEYESKSLEELRLEDYQLNRKGPQGSSGGIFGGNAVATQTNPFPSSTGAFGQFGQSSTNVFGSTLGQPKPGGIFGAAPASTGFGFGTGTVFGSQSQSNLNSTSQPQQFVFGFNNAATSTAGAGPFSSSIFSNPQQQQQRRQSLWNQNQGTPLTPIAAAPVFGSGTFGATAATANSTNGVMVRNDKPAFGTGTPIFDSGNAAVQQPKQFIFSSLTSTTPSSTATQNHSIFGGATSGFPTNSTISNANASSVFGSRFGTASASTGFGGGSFLAPAQNPSASFSFGTGTSNQNQIAALTLSPTSSFVFKPSGFASNSLNASSTGNASLFSFTGNASASNTAGGFVFSPQQQQQQQHQYYFRQPHQYSTSSGFSSFATSPFKDNALFYNFISTERLEQMTRPTSPWAISQYMKNLHRKSGSPSASSRLNLSWEGFYRISPLPRKSKSSSVSVSVSKFSIWEDGFEADDEASGYGVNILTPKKKDWKQLSLDSVNATMSSASTAAKLKSSLNKSLSNLSDSFNERVRLTASRSRWLKISQSYSFTERAVNQRTRLGNNSSVPGGRGDTSFTEEEAEVAQSSPENKKSTSTSVSSPSISTPPPSCGVICTRPGYYVKPPVEKLDKLVDINGDCFVAGFEVGRHNFGKIIFSVPVNVAGLNFDEIVFFRHKEVVVYPDDNEKPPLYEGLNVPAEVELEQIWPIDKSTSEPIRCPQKLEDLKFEKKLRKACARQDAEFISYSVEDCIWKFRVHHFSKYSCDLEEQCDD